MMTDLRRELQPWRVYPEVKTIKINRQQTLTEESYNDRCLMAIEWSCLRGQLFLETRQSMRWSWQHEALREQDTYVIAAELLAEICGSLIST